MSVVKKMPSKGENRKNFITNTADEDELREIFEILKKDKETCSLSDLSVAFLFLEQQFGYKLEERVKQDVKEIENNVVDAELTYEQFKSLVTQYEDEAVDNEIYQLKEILGNKNAMEKIAAE